MKKIEDKTVLRMIPYIIIIISALLLRLAYAPYSLWILAPLSFALFFYSIKLIKSKILPGFLFGFIFVLSLCPWIFHALFVYYKMGWIKSLSFYFFIAIWGSLQFLFFSIILKTFINKFDKSLNIRKEFLLIIFIASSFVILEWLRGIISPEHQWGHLATIFYLNAKFLYITRFTGGAFISFLIVLSGGFFWRSYENTILGKIKTGGLYLIIPFITFFFLYATGYVAQQKKISSYQKIKCAAIHSGIKQSHRWQKTFHRNNLAIFETMSSQAFFKKEKNKDIPKLILWPETALTFSLQSNNEAVKIIKNITKTKKSYLLTGTPSYRGFGWQRKFYNSIFQYSTDGEIINQYDKINLLPFAEKKLIEINVKAKHDSSLYHPGKKLGTFKFISTEKKFKKFSSGILICFEIANSSLVQKLAKEKINLLLNFSNDAWFGNGSESLQQTSILVLKSTEYAIPSIRTSGYGLSAFIDSFGKITKKSSIEKKEIIESTVTLPVYHETFFCKFKDWFILFCGFFIVIFLFKKDGKQGI